MNQIVSMNASLVYHTRCLAATKISIPSFFQSSIMLAYTSSTSEGLKWLRMIVSNDPKEYKYFQTARKGINAPTITWVWHKTNTALIK
jgi:hypothetical protein